MLKEEELVDIELMFLINNILQKLKHLLNYEDLNDINSKTKAIYSLEFLKKDIEIINRKCLNHIYFENIKNKYEINIQLLKTYEKEERIFKSFFMLLDNIVKNEMKKDTNITTKEFEEDMVLYFSTIYWTLIQKN